VKTGTFDPNDSSTYNFPSTATVYDSLGTSNTASIYYVKTSTANTWNVYVTVNGTTINGSSPGTLSFNTDGTLSSSTGLSALQFAPTSGATSPQTFSVSLNSTNITQYAQPDTVGKFTQDGSQAGLYTGCTLDKDGKVYVSYSSGGNPTLVGQVALATFSVPQNLTYLGNGMWGANAAAGAATISPSNSNGYINPSTYETSNVNMASELVKLISSQNSFQANAQVEQVYNQIMQTVTKL
jgi:flagellar hook protein FlgE